MSALILRYEVPVDDRRHTLTLRGDVVHLGARRPDVVEVWAIADQACLKPPTEYLVVGTGQTWPPGANYVGTTMAAGGALVWHLLRF